MSIWKRRPWHSVLVSIAIAAATTLAHAQSQPPFPSAARLAALEDRIRQQMALDRTTGISLAFQLGDSVWARGFGFADVENSVPATPRSSYRLASVTKPMTASAVLQLSEQGKIDLDAPIQTYVPYFPQKPQPVTVRQLLQHLGGITHYKNRDIELHITQHKSTREAIAIFQDYDLVAEPGTRYSYSTYGYNLLGAAIETASGQSYGDYLRDHIWQPLGMSDTRIDDPTAVIPNRVRGYRLLNGAIANSEFIDTSSRFAGGGLRGTVLDLLAFARGYQEGRVVSAESIDRMTTPGVTRDGEATFYGLGWDLQPVNGHYMTSHSGGQNETRTMLFSIPGPRCAIAAATNYEGADIYYYAQRVAELALDEMWDRSGGTAIYTADPVDAARIANLREAFNHGLFAFEKHGPLRIEDAQLRQAFGYFNACMDRQALKANRKETLAKIDAGRWPANGEASVVVGCFIATKLHENLGADRIAEYHRTNAIPFFHDYVDLAGDYRLPSEVEKSLERWARDWQRTCTPEIRTLVVAPFVDLDGLETRLQATFKGAVVYPDFNEALTRPMMQLLQSKQDDRALRAATLASKLYPQSAEACRSLAIAHFATGKNREARVALRKGTAIGEDWIVGPDALRSQAFDLYHTGKAAAAAEMARASVEVYPHSAVLYDAIGNLEDALGHKEAAIAGYRKALEIDPSLDGTREALTKLESE